MRRFGRQKSALALTDAASSSAACLDARLLVVRMILEFTKEPTLLEFLAEALQSLIYCFVGVDVDLNQTLCLVTSNYG